MLGCCMRPAAAGALILSLLISSAAGQAGGGQGTPAPSANQQSQTEAERAAAAKAEADKKAAAEKAEAERKAAEKAEADKKAAAAKLEAEKKARSFDGHFATHELAGGGGASNELHVHAASTELFDPTTGKITWGAQPNERFCPRPYPKDPRNVTATSKIPHPDKEKFPDWSVIGIYVPSPPCWWPIYQEAYLEITGKASPERGKPEQDVSFFKGSVSVSVFWFPLAFTLLAVLLIYPGCAMAAWYASLLRYRKDAAEAVKAGKPVPEQPSFWPSLDPVELTKNEFGRGSVGKMQIFLFTIIVFALLLFHLLRTGTIANMSTDVLMLLGISAFGAAGGKLVSSSRRRLGMENWAWLRKKKWLTSDSDIAPRAKWGELFLDGDTKEFDPYTFQMAIFSFVVAIALIRTNLSGLGNFRIPPELLALLGISQVVYIGGRAIDKGGYADLDKKLDELRGREKKFQELILKAEVAPATAPADQQPPVQTAKELRAAAEAERQAFKTDVEQAATIFWGIYAERIGKKTKELEEFSRMEPEVHKPPVS